MARVNESQTKQCAWCKSTITRGKRRQAEWDDLMTCTAKCASYWKWNKCSKDDLIVVDKYCKNPECRKLMERKPKESLTNWNERETCGRSCADDVRRQERGKYFQPKPDPVKDEMQRLHVKVYVPGSPEFNRVAKQYLERGF